MQHLAQPVSAAPDGTNKSKYEVPLLIDHSFTLHRLYS